MKGLEEVAAIMCENGLDARVFAKTAQAREYMLANIGQGVSVGIGGSVTVRDMGLAEALRAHGHMVYWHWEGKGAEMDTLRDKANSADTYLCSANALTANGVLVSADGTGNRLAGSFYGPKDVWFVVGKNKLVDTLQDAIDRIDHIASPLNARRLNITPEDRRIYSVITLIDRPTNGRRMHVLLIEEDLGY